MRDKQKQIKLTLKPDLYDKLDQGAQENGLSLATYVRLLICQQLGQKKNLVIIEESVFASNAKRQTLKQMADLL